jgi:hypothetical protein
MRRSCYIVGGCLAIAVMASACGGDGDSSTGSPASGGMASGGGGSAGSEQGTGGVPVACPEGCIQICQAGICDCDCSGTGGGAGVGGTATGGSAGTGGTGGSDCQCPSAAWEPVCGVDGNTHNAVCGADCVPVDIACVGECPCDAGGASCDIGGCAAPVDAGWCESPAVAWVCDGIDPLLLPRWLPQRVPVIHGTTARLWWLVHPPASRSRAAVGVCSTAIIRAVDQPNLAVRRRVPVTFRPSCAG